MTSLLFWIVLSFSVKAVIGFVLNRRAGRKWYHFEWDKGLTTALIIFSTVVLGSLYVVVMEYEEWVLDAPHYSDLFARLLPPWYDRMVEDTLPNILIALAVTSVLSISVSGCLFRLVSCFILCCVWGYLGGRFPWEYAKHIGAFPDALTFGTYPPVRPSMLTPLWLQTGLAVSAALALALMGFWQERKRSKASRIWF